MGERRDGIIQRFLNRLGIPNPPIPEDVTTPGRITPITNDPKRWDKMERRVKAPNVVPFPTDNLPPKGA